MTQQGHDRKKEKKNRRLILFILKPAMIFLLLSAIIMAFALAYLHLPVSAPADVTYAGSWWERGGRFSSRSLVLQTSEGTEYLVAGYFSGGLFRVIEEGVIQPGDSIRITTTPSLPRDMIVTLTHNGEAFSKEEDLIAYREKVLRSAAQIAAIIAGVGLLLSGGILLMERKELSKVLKKRKRNAS